MRYFVRIQLGNGIQWRTLMGSSAKNVACDLFKQVDSHVNAVWVCRASHPEDVFCDADFEADESRIYMRQDCSDSKSGEPAIRQ